MLPPAENSRISLATPEPPYRLPHYQALIDDPRIEWRGQLPYPFYPADLDGLDALIVSDEWAHEVRACIAACKLRNIPTFHILDGVIRWKNLFENPRSSVAANGSPFLRPLLSDMTFVMGDLQAAILRWLGNSKVCVSGLPRFASYEPKNCAFGPSAQPSLLLASSNRPWYTDAQRDFFIPAFQRLLDTLQRDCKALGVPFHCRLSPLVEWENIDPSWLGPHPPFQEQLRQNTALITTPSTIAVEGMMLGIPTLIFDPWADPFLVTSAWTADDANAVSTLLPSLLSPTRERASLQDFLRNFTIRDSRDAADLIVREILREVADRRHPASGSPILTPDRLPIREAPPLSRDMEWDLHTSHVVGLVETIPQLVAMLHEERITKHTIHQLADTIQSTNTPFLRVMAHKLKALLSGSRRPR